MELPYHLQILEPLPGALDIIRYLGSIDAPSADIDEICEALEMSDRRFNKAMRRLVTRGYAQMVGDLVYSLTDNGRSAAQTLREYDAIHPPSARARDDDNGAQSVKRRLVIAMPQALSAQTPNPVIVGIDGGDDRALNTPAEIVLRLSVINGDPFMPEEAVIRLGNQPIQTVFSVTPEDYTQVRIRLQAFQLGPNPDDINVSGGFYVDAGVTATATRAGAAWVAYGSDISIQILE